MIQKVYDELWNKIILDNIKFISNEIAYGNKRHIDIKKIIKETYEDLKEAAITSSWLKPNDNHRLDRHKVSSLLTHSILMSNPFEKTHIKGDCNFYSEYANELLAYQTSMATLFSFNIKLAEEDRQHKKKDIFANINNIHFPKVKFYKSNSNQHYIVNLLKLFRKIALIAVKYENEKEELMLSIQSLSHLFFFIEQYHFEKYLLSMSETARVP